MVGCGESVRAVLSLEGGDRAFKIRNLASIDPAKFERMIWTVASHRRENPAMFGAWLSTALSIECALGHGDGALPILRLYLETLESLFKFKDIPDRAIAGYPLRWDAIGSDAWAVGPIANQPGHWYSCEFLLDEQGRHSYLTPFHHPGYVPWNPTKDVHNGNDDNILRQISRGLNRDWEPSMDEICGLVSGYAVMTSLSGDNGVGAAARGQLERLARFLAANGYILIRPGGQAMPRGGGITSRGGTGVLPAMEYPFGRAFQRITRNPYGSEIDWQGTMEKAGEWPMMRDIVAKFDLLGLVVPPVFGPIAPGTLGQVLGTLASDWVHDVSTGDSRGEFCLACLLKLMPPFERFQTWMSGPSRLATALGDFISESPLPLSQPLEHVRTGLENSGKYANNFPQYIGLMSIGDSDPTVRDAYIGYLNGVGEDRPRGDGSNTGLGCAVAVALGDRTRLVRLRNWLEEAWEHITTADGGRPELLDLLNTDKTIYGVAESVADRYQPMGALEYLASLALAWYAGHAGLDPDGVLPRLPPDAPPFPTPEIGAALLRDPPMPSLLKLATRLGNVPDHYAVFPTGTAQPTAEQRRPPEPVPYLPDTSDLETFDLSIPEYTTSVMLPTEIKPGDRVRLIPSGAIFAGVLLTGNNGPGGWDALDTALKFPLPGDHPFCLLYRLLPDGMPPDGHAVGAAPWRRLPAEIGFVYQNSIAHNGRIEFRTNDDAPGNGNGAFSCRVEIRRAREPVLN